MEDPQIKKTNNTNKEECVNDNNLNKFINIKAANTPVKAAILSRSLSVEDSADEDYHTCLGVHPETGRLRWCVHNKHLRLLIVVPAALLPITILFILLSRLEFVEPYRHGGQRSSGLGGVSRGGRDNIGMDRITMGQFGDVKDCTAREIRLNNPELLDAEEREILRDIRTSFIPPRDSYVIQNSCKNINNLVRNKRTSAKTLVFVGNMSSDIMIWTSNNKSVMAKIHKEANFTVAASDEDDEGSYEDIKSVTESSSSDESETECDMKGDEQLPNPDLITEKDITNKSNTKNKTPSLQKKKTNRSFRDSLGSEEALESRGTNTHQKNVKEPIGSLGALNFQINANMKSLEAVEKKMKELENDEIVSSNGKSSTNATTSNTENITQSSTPPSLHSAFWKGQGSAESIRKTQADAMLHYMDQNANPCDDFYQYACGNWEKVNPIPADKAGYDTFEMLRESLDAVLKQLLTEGETAQPSYVSNNTHAENQSMQNPLLGLKHLNIDNIPKVIIKNPIINNHLELTTTKSVPRRKRNIFGTFIDRFKNIERRQNVSGRSTDYFNVNQANLLRQIRKVIKKQYASYFSKDADLETQNGRQYPVQNGALGSKDDVDNDKYKYWLIDNDILRDLQNGGVQEEKDVFDDNNNFRSKNDDEIPRVVDILREPTHPRRVDVLDQNNIENDEAFSDVVGLGSRRSIDGVNKPSNAEKNPEVEDSEKREKIVLNASEDDITPVKLEKNKDIEFTKETYDDLTTSESSDKKDKASNNYIPYESPDDKDFRNGKLTEKLKIHYEASKLKHHKVNVRKKREENEDPRMDVSNTGFVWSENWKNDNDFDTYTNRIKRKENQIKLSTDVLTEELSNNSYTFSTSSTANHKSTIEVNNTTEKITNNTKSSELDVKPTKPNDAIRKAKDLYASCMNYSILEQRGNGPLLELLKNLGGWPVIHTNWTEESFDWLVLAANLRLYNNDILIAEWVGPDIKNSDEYVIQFDQTSLGLPTRDYFLQASNQQYLDAYKEYLIKVCVLMGATEERATTAAEEIIDFEKQLAKITSAPEERRNVSVLYQRLTIGRLRQLIPQIDWLRYLNIVLDRPANSSETVVMFALNYMEDLVTLLSNTESRVVSNYLMWRFVRHRVNNLDDRFQGAKQKFYFVLFGREQSPPRWKNCVAQVNSNMGMALGAMFVRRYFDETSKQDTTQMTSDIQQSFRELLNMTDWIDGETKQLAGLKVDAMLLRIGYPDYILNNDVLNEKYEDVVIDKDLYFENTLNILKHLTRQEQCRLGELVNKTLWHTAPAVVNAYYSRNKNQIMFPAGILQPPFYHRHFPRSLNYGGIGVVIGHELTHGFDDKGRLFDRDGNLHRWWSDQSIEGFHERAQCLIDQYSNYTVSEVGMAIDGFNTQGENIADNGGIKQAFRAYERWLTIHGDANETLPGINATNKQLFFLNFAQVWCGAMRPEATRNKLKTAVHSPGRFRVVGTLSNSDDFAREYNCPSGTKMNPSKKCSVW